MTVVLEVETPEGSVLLGSGLSSLGSVSPQKEQTRAHLVSSSLLHTEPCCPLYVHLHLAVFIPHASCRGPPPHTEAPVSSAAASLQRGSWVRLWDTGLLPAFRDYQQGSPSDLGRTQPRVPAGTRGWGQPEARRCAAEPGLRGGWGAWPAGCDLGLCTCVSLPDGNGSLRF